MMTHVEGPWSHTNPGPDDLRVWLEPWADEFIVPGGSTIVLTPSGEDDGRGLGEVEWNSEQVTVWASASMIEVHIDGALQASGSTKIPLPPGLSRDMLHLMFAGHPSARLGGKRFDADQQAPWWRRAIRRLGLHKIR